MKRVVLILTILALMLSFSNVSIAQITEKGIKVGLNLANASGDDVEDTKNKMGFAVGGYILYPLNETITMRVEAMYSQKGAKMEGEMPVVETLPYFPYYTYEMKDYTATMSVDYIEIPVLFLYEIQSSGTMKPFVFAGPYLALKMSAKTKVEVEGEDSETEDMKDVKGMDYGIILGAGAKVTDKISVDVRYSMGLTSVDDSDADADIKNKVIAVTAGYALN